LKVLFLCYHWVKFLIPGLGRSPFQLELGG
jgi:hypothetical protein